MENFPHATNIVIDFEAGLDVIGLTGISGVSSVNDLTFTQGETGAVISAMGQDIAVLNDVHILDIGSNSFAFA